MTMPTPVSRTSEAKSSDALAVFSSASTITGAVVRASSLLPKAP